MTTYRFHDVAPRLRRALSIDYVAHDGQRLPPNHMRYCGSDFRDDAVFLGSGRAEARRLAAEFGMGPQTRVLEIGCGPGRLPLGILAEQGTIGSYDGVDIDAASIDWCRRHVTRRHPAFRFHHVEARHERYNPDGRPMREGFRLEFEDDRFDLVYLHSVFANMNPDDVSVYCAEFARVLAPEGRVFLTAFIEEGVPDFTVNPEDYLIESKGPMNVVRYDRDFFFGLVRRAGLEVARYDHGADLGGQSLVHLTRAVAPSRGQDGQVF